ncbi:FeoB-associated Cys-rich membrane protein [Gelatiniphilus marinus]|uniref:FeoB-associated Cys-rich membrane protein n=1 Tax=Gelatiniphilus marinus TaxID=1759464 RepID=A0ABW5JX06_9FLAO
MNTIIQNIIAFTILAFAIRFLILKFVWNPKKKTNNPDSYRDCGSDAGCGCS